MQKSSPVRAPQGQSRTWVRTTGPGAQQAVGADRTFGVRAVEGEKHLAALQGRAVAAAAAEGRDVLEERGEQRSVGLLVERQPGPPLLRCRPELRVPHHFQCVQRPLQHVRRVPVLPEVPHHLVRRQQRVDMPGVKSQHLHAAVVWEADPSAPSPGCPARPALAADGEAKKKQARNAVRPPATRPAASHCRAGAQDGLSRYEGGPTHVHEGVGVEGGAQGLDLGVDGLVRGRLPVAEVLHAPGPLLH